MGALSVVVEDAQDLRRTVMRPEGMRNHGGELRCLAGLDHDGPLSQQQHNGSRQDGEPVPAGVDLQLAGPAPGFRPGDTHLGHGDAMRPGLPAQHPGGQPSRRIVLRPDHHIVVVDGLHQLVEGGPQRPGDRTQLVEADPPVARLDPAQGGRAQVAAGSQVVERPAQGRAQPPDPLADQAVEIVALRHTQDVMSNMQAARRLEAWKTTTTTIPRPGPGPTTRPGPGPGPGPTSQPWPSSWTSMPRYRSSA